MTSNGNDNNLFLPLTNNLYLKVYTIKFSCQIQNLNTSSKQNRCICYPTVFFPSSETTVNSKGDCLGALLGENFCKYLVFLTEQRLWQRGVNVLSSMW